MISLIGSALGLAGNLATNWLDRKKNESEAKLNIAKARAAGEMEWDIAQAKASESSWKDEYWTIILSIPLIMCFVPSWAPYVEQGFTVLKKSVPEWYVIALGAAISAAFGFKGMNKIITARKGK